MEAKQAQLQTSVNDMMDKIDQTKLRPMQRTTYLKMAECYNSKSASANGIQECVQKASTPSNTINQLIQQEMSQFQDRLQRCSMNCRDETKDKYPNPSGNPEAEKMITNCLGVCADKHIDMLKSIRYNLEQKVDEVTKRW
ncbi:hypothetical protein B484DRAFT_452189 [Ochromonadaceae sp. CCMP2298]|nr:hypothetical protein B484DRAFT_452189 [Ochromonadaceae sp. CCMP2298]|mmetsp:Transcript_35206/g.77581  ORF Transcript_35206/g.77581 Transcript_35206/m.77581 type:complete len:140 (+) Transcript_35206:82-501(+)